MTSKASETKSETKAEPTAEEKLRFLTPKQCVQIREEFGSPVYVYSEESIFKSAAAVVAFPNAYGLTPRYAMKTNPNAAILKLMLNAGISIDASSGYECLRAMRAGYAGKQISLSSQEWYGDFKTLHGQGVTLNACSIHQIHLFGELFPGQELGLRFNPGIGSGGTNKTNVGGPSSSFGIWHEKLAEVQEAVKKHKLRVVRLHTHIGSGSDPAVWQRVTHLSLALVEHFPDVVTLNLGGGFKVGRMTGEKSTDLQVVGAPVKKAFEEFAGKTGRKLRLEIEPGTYLMANNGCILSTIQDTNDTRTVVASGAGDGTSEAGFRFLKLDTGMTEILRPSLYGAQHPVIVVPVPRKVKDAESKEASSSAASSKGDAKSAGAGAAGESKNDGDLVPYVAVGHCCESGDLVTPAPSEADVPHARLCQPARIGDICVIEGAGSYCSSMSSKNYNSFPEAAEVLVRADGSLALIRRRQTLDQVLQNEVPLS